jgi:transcriptional regulator with XRE-family HTH domain
VDGNPQIGAEVRERRRQLGLSVRALAARAGISPAYVTAIETANNPTTGKAPRLSLAIVQRLAEALELDVGALIDRASPAADHGTHVLVYVLSAPTGGILAPLVAQYAAAVDHWVHIVDPRAPDDQPAENVSPIRFALGADPYATATFDADALMAALDREIAVLAPILTGRRVGLLISDCSAVMRYLRDASAPVANEASWHDDVAALFLARLGGGPAVDACAYLHDDVAALGLTIDQLQTAVDLISRHDRVLALDGDVTVSGAPAIRRILAGARPSGASSGAWEQLASAAARTLVGVHER